MWTQEVYCNLFKPCSGDGAISDCTDWEELILKHQQFICLQCVLSQTHSDELCSVCGCWLLMQIIFMTPLCNTLQGVHEEILQNGKKKKKGGWHVLPLSVNCAEENSAFNAKQRILLNLGSTTLHRGPLWIVNESNSSCYSWFDFKQLFLFINFVNKHIRFLFCNVF